MKLLEGQKFLFLPNREASRIRFLAELIIKEGAIIVDKEEEIDQNTYVLVNDAFVNKDNTLIQDELFFKELDFNPSVVRYRIVKNNLTCAKASSISYWLRSKSFEIQPNSLISIDGLREITTVVDLTRESGDATSSAMDTNICTQDSNKMKLPPEIKTPPDSKAVCLVRSSPTDEAKKENEKLVQALGKLSKRYEMKGDQFRARGYNLAKIGIQQYPFKIESGEQARQEISNVGPSIAKKIQTILENGSLPGLLEAFDLEKNLEYFVKCYNVGMYRAKNWDALQLKTFAEACDRFANFFVTDWPILFGWSYYEDWLMPISREECKRISIIVRKEAQLLDPELRVETLGSYCRGFEQCGDVDLLFYKPNCNDCTQIGGAMENVSIALYAKGYVQCFLQLTARIDELFRERIIEQLKKCHIKISQNAQFHDRSENLRKFLLGFKLVDEEKCHIERQNFRLTPKLNSKDQFMSLSSEENPCRRVDLFCCKYSELGSARLHWTGPKEFNRWLRLKAINKGLKLTQHGLFDSSNILLESFSERRIFELLDEEYIAPIERNNVVKKRQKL